MGKSQLDLSKILAIIISVVFIWVFLFSIWYSNNILNQEKFVATTTQVLESEEVRNAISSEIITTIQIKRPIIGSFAAPLLTKVIAGVLDSNLYSNVNTKMAQEIQLQLTSANPREIYIELRPTKDFLGSFIQKLDPNLLNNIPDQISLIKRNQIPSLYKLGTFLTIGGPILLIAALIILGYIWRKVEDKRNYITILSLCFAGSALLIYFLIPAIGSYLIAQTGSTNIALIINDVFTAFTAPISSFASNVVIAGIIIALVAKFVRREIFRLPQKNNISRTK